MTIMNSKYNQKSLKQYWVFGSFKITFLSGAVIFNNAYTEIEFVMGKSTSDVLNDFIAQEKKLIQEHFSLENLVIEHESMGIISDLNDLPKAQWICR